MTACFRIELLGRDFWDVAEEAFFSPGPYYYEQNALDTDITNAEADADSFLFGG